MSLPTNFTPSKKDSPTIEEQIKETKLRFGNLYYRSVIGALLDVSCCTRPDKTYAVNKFAKFSHNPGTIHFRAYLHLIGFLKNTSYKGLKFFSDFKYSNVYKLLSNNNIEPQRIQLLSFLTLHGMIV